MGLGQVAGLPLWCCSTPTARCSGCGRRRPRVGATTGPAGRHRPCSPRWAWLGWPIAAPPGYPVGSPQRLASPLHWPAIRRVAGRDEVTTMVDPPGRTTLPGARWADRPAPGRVGAHHPLPRRAAAADRAIPIGAAHDHRPAPRPVRLTRQPPPAFVCRISQSKWCSRCAMWRSTTPRARRGLARVA